MDIQALAGSLLAQPDPQTHAQLESVKESSDGWSRCIDAVVSGQLRSEEELFFCLQIVEHFLRRRYDAPAVVSGAQDRLRALLRHWITHIGAADKQPKVYLRNKMSQIAALVFVIDFPARWANFFAEVFAGDVLGSEASVDFYLRTLIAIDSEVADRDIARSKDELARSTVVKDAMRETCVPSIVDSWANILSSAVSSSAGGEIGSLCLAVVGAYIAWIDISLVANDRFVPLIVASLSKETTSEAGCDCVCSIIEKGMEPRLKVELVEAFNGVLQAANFFSLSPESEVEAAVRVGTLLNCMAMELIECHNRLLKEVDTTELKGAAAAALEAKLPLIVACLAHDELEVSQTVTEGLHAYVVWLKAVAALPPGPTDAQRATLGGLLRVAMAKFRFPPDYNHEKEGEDEALFLEYRKDLKSIFTNIGMLDTELALAAVESALGGAAGAAAADVNVALCFLYFLGEIFPANTGALFASTDPKGLRLKDMLRQMVVGELSSAGQPCVVLEYFEILVRYDKFFGTQPDLLPRIVSSMLDTRGLHHPSSKVRARVAYLFARFVKLQRTALHAYVGEILGQMGDLLGGESQLGPEDQLFLYEATASLIVVGSFTPECKAEYMRSLVGSLVARFDAGLARLPAAATPEEKAAVLAHLNDIIAFASRTTKAFSDKLTMRSCLCSDIFLQLMGTFMDAIGTEQGALLNSFRQYLHRMVMCLDAELLDKLPLLLRRFIAVTPDLKSFQDFLVLVQQIVSKFKAASVGPLSGEVGSLWVYVVDLLGRPAEGLDEEAQRDLVYVRRASLQLLLAALNNKAVALVTAPLGSDGGRVLPRVLGLVEETAASTRDPLSARQAFSAAHRLVDATQDADPTLQQMVWSWAMERMVAVGFRVPLSPDFDLSDAQGLHVVHELAACLIKFTNLKGESYLEFLCAELLPGLGLEAGLSRDVALNVKANLKSPKNLQKYLKVLFESQKKAFEAS